MYQAGGATQGSILQEIAKLPQEQQKQIMMAFGKWAQSKGLNIQQLQGNEQALEQALTQFLQEMQGTQKARLGAKLNYLRSIKGSCPEGQELVYFREGGRVCKKCIQKNAYNSKGMAAVKAFKDKCGSKMKKKSCKEFGGEIQSDKCGSKMKKSKKEFGGEIQFDKCGSKMKAQNGMKANNKTSNKWTQKDDNKLLKYRRMGTKTPEEKRDSLAVQRKWNNLPEKEKAKYEVQEQKCGGKAKKHFYGGSLNRIPFYQRGTSKGGITRTTVMLDNSGTNDDPYAYTSRDFINTTIGMAIKDRNYKTRPISNFETFLVNRLGIPSKPTKKFFDIDYKVGQAVKDIMTPSSDVTTIYNINTFTNLLNKVAKKLTNTNISKFKQKDTNYQKNKKKSQKK